MMDFKVDYHIHTTYSDGALKPVEIIKKRKAEEYDIVAITDHDGIDGLDEALTAGEALEIQVIPGVEISTKTHEGVKVHILGYKFDRTNQKLIDTLKELQENRKERNARLLKALQDLGYDITMEDVIARPGQTYFGKPHFAMALVNKGYAKTKKEAFDNIFERDEIKAIQKKGLNTKDAIELINQAGGMAVLAHPGEIKLSKEEVANLVFELKKAGLKGIECYHPSHDNEAENFFISLASKYHLHITQGSDFHE
ncbi:MAG: PHP domain-containing protein [Clostridia bacterium]|nr:PHP domain-containing protein [Clostridia bacterium]